MEIQDINDLTALNRLIPEWEHLFQITPSATPFQSPAWIVPWWKYFGNGELFVFALRHLGELVGIVPLCQTIADSNTLCFIGQGNSDYLDGLFDDRFAQSAAHEFLAHLTRRHGNSTRCELTQVPPSSPLLQSPVRGEHPIRIVPASSCYVLALPKTVEQWRAQLPRNLRQNLRYYRHRAERAGAIRFENVDPANPDRLLRSFFVLHRQRWETQGLPGALATKDACDFHREFIGMLPGSQLRLKALNFQGEVAAVGYAFDHGPRTFLYLTGMNPNTAAYSFGNQLLNEMIEDAIRAGHEQFDLLRGNEPYKIHFGAKERPTFHLTIFSSPKADSVQEDTLLYESDSHR